MENLRTYYVKRLIRDMSSYRCYHDANGGDVIESYKKTIAQTKWYCKVLEIEYDDSMVPAYVLERLETDGLLD